MWILGTLLRDTSFLERYMNDLRRMLKQLGDTSHVLQVFRMCYICMPTELVQAYLYYEKSNLFQSKNTSCPPTSSEGSLN